jgi:hypothetical protein
MSQKLSFLSAAIASSLFFAAPASPTNMFSASSYFSHIAAAATFNNAWLEVVLVSIGERVTVNPLTS